MGQYYKIVNLDKRQYLHPHKFGAGLKLMEFSGKGDSIMQAVAILLSSGNGRGGGDIHSENHDPEGLVGSWAGDRIVVAGDYMDKWLMVPEDLKGKEYVDEDCRKRRFGFREKPREKDAPKDAPTEYYGETLYSAAEAFFEDISDKIIKVIAAGDSPYHPFAAMDFAEDGWRHPPESGVLPLAEPKKPAAGAEVYEKYKQHSISPEQNLADQIKWFAQRHPERAAALFKAVRKVMRKPREKK
jgi:hypothetical protein